MPFDDVNKAIQAARRRQAQEQSKKLLEEPIVREARTTPVPVPRRARPSMPTNDDAGGRLRMGEIAGDAAYFLGRSQIMDGDPVELFTNTANGWIRGRFVWNGSVDDRPSIAINLWDPRGTKDADGLPPKVGEMVSPLPKRAVLRWPV